MNHNLPSLQAAWSSTLTSLGAKLWPATGQDGLEKSQGALQETRGVGVRPLLVGLGLLDGGLVFLSLCAHDEKVTSGGMAIAQWIFSQ